MCVGGRIIESRAVTLDDVTLVRLWVCDRNGDEVAVFAEQSSDMPKLGDEIWWQSGKIMFDNDRKFVRKIGYSFNPQG